EYRIAGGQTAAGADGLGAVRFEVTRDRAFRAVGVEHDVAQPAGALGFRPVVQLVEEAAWLACAARRGDRSHDAARGGDAREQAEAGTGELRRHVGDL